MTSPLTIHSSSNEMVVRFTSNDEEQGRGFLILYSSLHWMVHAEAHVNLGTVQKVNK